MRLGVPCVVGAVQVAPTPRIRPREVPRHGGRDAHGASKSRPSDLKLALVAYWYGPAVCAVSSRHIWHIGMVNALPGACMRPAKPINLLPKRRATGRYEARVAVLTVRRRRCAHAAAILQHSGAFMRLGRPCVVGAVQVAPTPRIRPREVPRHGGRDAHGASNSHPSNLKLALVAYWYGPAVRAESSRHIWHIRIVNARPGARTRLRSTGRPLPAYSRRLVSLQAARSLCHAYGMHASRWQQQACVWNAASGGRCVR